jgi:uncharacterized protein (TIGR00297 family)
MTLQLILGFALAAIVSLGALRLHSLSRSGALAAFFLGTIVFGLGGLAWAVILLTFFISSSALSRFAKRRKTNLEKNFSKGSERDAGQVLANGGIAGLFVILNAIFPQSIFPWLGFVGALAAANADTWATELGVLSKKPPILITTLKRVERGTSGGVSLAGTVASFCGSLLVAIVFGLLFRSESFSAGMRLVIIAALAGLVASLVDSLIGATVQSMYFCPVCQKETERHPIHSCGNSTVFIRGWKWMNNDWVNGVCTLTGSLLAIGLFLLIQ